MKFLMVLILFFSSSVFALDALIGASKDKLSLFSFEKGKLVLKDLNNYQNTSTYAINPMPSGKQEIDTLNTKLSLISSSKTPIKIYDNERTTVEDIETAYQKSLKTASRDVLQSHVDQLMRDIEKLQNESTCNPANTRSQKAPANR